MFILGCFLLVLGFCVKFYLHKSSFERRNQAGVEVFSSYWDMIGVGIINSIGFLIIIAGIICIIFSGFLSLVE